MDPDRTRQARTRSGWILAVLAAYLVVSALCYYDGFFRFVAAGGIVLYLPAGLVVMLDDGGWSVTPWARIPILLGTAYALVRCTRAVREGIPSAKLWCFATSFGLLRPQVWMLRVYMMPLRDVPLLAAAPVALLVTGIPAAAVGRPGLLRRFDAVDDAGRAGLRFGQRRLLLTLIALGWLGFLAEFDVGWTAFWPWEPFGFATGVAAMALACMSAIGLLRLRVWALFGALGTAGLVTATVLAFMRPILAASGACSGWSAVAGLPVVVVLGLTWPFWRFLGARLREG